MWSAWVRPDGSIARIFMDGEPTPEFSERTHRLIALDDTKLADAKAGKLWDPQAGRMIDAPPEPVKTPQEVAAEARQARAAIAEAYIARMPPGVLDALADRVAQRLAERSNP